MNFKYKNAVILSHYILMDKLSYGDIAVDATCGNGFDSLLLSKAVGDRGRVFCFDIQDKAIESTKAKLISAGASKNYILIKDGHENLDKYIDCKIKACIFNLGYLPGGEHNIITTPQNTITAIEKLLRLLLPGGVIVIVVYYGHEGGEYEKEELIRYMSRFDNKKYTVLTTQFTNQKNYPPMLIVIEKSYGQNL